MWYVPILAFLKAINWRVWIGLIAFALGVAATLSYGNYRERKGEMAVQGRWDAANTAQEQKIRELEAKQGQVTVKTVTEYVDRVKTVYLKGETIIKRIPHYVPADAPDLPGGWRLLHDAAATGAELPETPGDVQAEPVSAQAAAETVSGNYTACRAELLKLQGLWDWSNGVAGSVGGSR